MLSRPKEEKNKLFAEADVLYDGHHYEEALPLLKKALCEKNRKDCLTMIGLCYLHLDKPASAAFVFQKLIQENPDWSFPLVNLARVYLEIGKYKAAKKLLGKAHAIDPDSEEPYFYSGLLYDITGKFSKAILSYKKALNVIDTLGETHFNIAYCYYRTHQYKKAIKEYHRSIELNHPKGNAFYGLGVIYHRFNQYKQSLYYFKRSYNLDPSNISTMCLLAEAYYMVGNITKSKELYYLISEQNPEQFGVFKKRKLFSKIEETDLYVGSKIKERPKTLF